MHDLPERPDFADDADLEHPWAKKYRIPLVSTLYPRWRYEVALAVPRDDDLYRLVWPTEDEARAIGIYIDHRRNWYREGYRQRMLARPLDVDSGTNTVVLAKNEDGWHYRRDSWTSGGLWFPGIHHPEEIRAPYTPDLAGLLAVIRHSSASAADYVEATLAA